jgi:DNA-binding GntR family transcriptional regulator
MPPPRRENSTVDALLSALRHDITSGTLKPGQRLDLDEWGERMGASRTPVRQALERLEAEGFVKLSGRRGATIIEVTLTHIEDVLSTRLVLDSALGRAGTRNLEEDDLDVLADLLAAINRIVLPGQHTQMVEPALDFHTYLYRAAGAAMMLRLAMQTVHHTNVFLSSVWFSNRRIAYVGKTHFKELYVACQLKDLDRVELLIREYRIDMAGVILRGRARTEELQVLPGVLTGDEFCRLRAIVDDGQDPLGPSATSNPSPNAQRTTVELERARRQPKPAVR